MSSVVFYKDANELFECDIKIDGASYSNTKVRLVLEFNDKALLIPGFINEGHVEIDVPKLSNIDDKKGKAILEVIADSTYFEAWSSEFDIENKQSVQVSEVRIGNKKPSIVVESISKETSKEIKKSKKSNPKKTIFKETVTAKNRKFVEQTLKGFKILNESEINEIKKDLSNYKPSSAIKKWAKTIFINPDSVSAKYCMMKLQKNL